MKVLETETIELYAKAVIAHDARIFDGKRINPNKFYYKIIACYNALLEKGCLHDFRSLLSYENPSVRGWAAVHLLETLETEALETLRDVAKGDGLSSLSAETVLEQWNKGEFKMPC